MNYIGSKLSLLEFLEESIDRVINKKNSSFCDLFAGTGIVGRYFKKKGYSIIANDIQYYSYVLNKHFIGNNQFLSFSALFAQFPELKKINIGKRKDYVCQYLSDLDGVKGFIFNNYCLGGTKGKEIERQYFSDYNGMKCDAIRQKIEAWKRKKKINDNEYFYLLATLLESIDKFANTASVYGAFLKKLKKSALKKLELKPLELYESEKEHQIYNEDVNKLIDNIECDILYLDPPYNQRQYATNYHMLETIAKYDNPTIYGKTGLREYNKQKSLYCSRVNVKNVFKELITKAKAKYIFLSYNNEGLLTLEDIKEIMSLRGDYDFFTKKYTRFKADKSENRDYLANNTTEYLHYVVCK